MAEIRAGAAAAAEQFQSDLRGKESSGLSGRWINVCSALISCFKCTGRHLTARGHGVEAPSNAKSLTLPLKIFLLFIRCCCL